MSDRSRADLLNKLTVLRDWVDNHYDELTEKRAYMACQAADKIWVEVERRAAK